MTLRKKAFTLIEMLVVIMIIGILAAALFPAISAAIESAKATAIKSKGRGMWTALYSANAEREGLNPAAGAVWPAFMPGITNGTATLYFQWLLGYSNSQQVSPICEDMKVENLAGLGVVPASSPATLGANTLLWCVAVESSTNSTDDALFYTKNVGFAALTAVGNATVPNLNGDATVKLGRGVWVTYGGAVYDARAKYIGSDENNNPTNRLVRSANTYTMLRP